jgi:DNA polymerase-3 subunit gamma/tau
VLSDLAVFTHFVTRMKIVPAVAEDVSLAEVERTRGRAFAEKLSLRVLARAWQMLLKGITEVGEASRPLAAAEMVLVRIAYAADLPTPDEVIRSLGPSEQGARPHGNGGGMAQSSAPAPAAQQEMRTPVPQASPPRGGAPRAALAPAAAPATNADAAPAGAPVLAVGRFEDLIALATSKRDIGVKLALERDVRLVRCEDGRLEIKLEGSAAKTLVNDLARKFSQWTNRRWMVVVSAEEGAPTVKAQNEARQSELKSGVRADPLVQAVLNRFPGAEIVGVRSPEEPAPSAPADDGEPPPVDDDSSYGADWRPDED